MTPRPAAISDGGPWSCQVCVLLGQQDAGQQPGHNAADDRADNRNPAVGPVGTALAGDREDGVRNARAKVTTRVDGVSGRPTEGGADADDQESDTQCAEPAEAARCLGGRIAPVTRRENDEHEDEGAEALGHEVPPVVADLRAGREDGQLEGGFRFLVELLLVRQPAQNGTDEGTDHLSPDVGEDRTGIDRNALDRLLSPVDHSGSHADAGGGVRSSHEALGAGGGNAQGDRRVEVSARLVRNEHASEDGNTPSPVDKQEACTGTLALGEDAVGYDATAQEQQHCRATNLREEDRSERHSHLFPTSVWMSLVARGTSPSLRRLDRRRSIART